MNMWDYEDGRDETILRYLDGDSGFPPYGPEAVSVSLRVEDRQDLLVLLEMAIGGLANSREQFISCVVSARSSDGGNHATRFKHLLALRSQLRDAAARLEGSEWLEKWEADLETMVANRNRERAYNLRVLTGRKQEQ
jgi:hypothetical protein